MTNNPFQKATKTRARLRMAISGASGSGKTYTALRVAQAFGKIAVIDTEHGSASKYADTFDFDVLELNNYHPQKYIDALNAAAGAGYDVVIIDSLSHAWNGVGGVLEIVDKAAAKSESKNTFSAWRDATPLQQKLVEALLSTPLHVIATMRSKTEYVLELDKRGKMSPRKVGTAPIQRDGIEYEFDVVGEINADHDLIITKTRVSMLADEVIPTPGIDLGNTLLKWLSDGAEAPQRPVQPPAQPDEPATASVKGAGLPQHPPQPEASHDTDPPNVYLCDALIVSKSRTATQYIVKTRRDTNIVITGYPALDTLRVNEMPVPALQAGTYPLEPAWKVEADLNDEGWEVHSVAVAVPA